MVCIRKILSSLSPHSRTTEGIPHPLYMVSVASPISFLRHPLGGSQALGIGRDDSKIHYENIRSAVY